MVSLLSASQLHRSAESIRKPQSRDLNELAEFLVLSYKRSAQKRGGILHTLHHGAS